ncbi:MAG: plastocyanin/azurin family copper-binding protein [Solitalea sp.]
MKNLYGVNRLLPIILLAGGMVGGCGLKSAHTPLRVEITIQQMQFTPSEVEVYMGDTVVFVNKGIVTHDVTGEAGEAWTSGPIPAGHTFELIAKENLPYYCSFHPTMKGSISVLPKND